MAVTADRIHHSRLHPLHAVLLAGTIPLFLAAMLSASAYGRTSHMEWD